MSATLGAPLGLPPRGAPPGAADTLTLIVGNRTWTGWQRVAVTRSMDTVPATFDIQVTERYPTGLEIAIKAGDPCQVKIGGDLVITGYVDRYTAAISGTDHSVRISGRSKSQDLVDSAALVQLEGQPPGFQMMGGSALTIAQTLAKPYGVSVTSIAGPGTNIPQFNINLGETAWEIIDRVTKISKLVCYDMPDGSLMMARAGAEQMASGLAQGGNVENATVTLSMDQRFSEYEAHLLSTMVYGNDTGVNAPGLGKPVKDEGVPRFRKRYVISEQTMMGTPIAYDRAVWERNRRLGRSQAVTITCDSWRDAAGALWAPNHLAPIRIPVLKLPDASWLIAAISYTRDETGQHAIITLMPREAFDPEPVVAQQTPAFVQDIEQNNPTRTP